MKIVNNTSGSIWIEDIKVAIPSAKKGVFTIKDSVAAMSRDIIFLMNSGKITAIVEESDIKTTVHNGVEYFVVPGVEVWLGNGKTKTSHRVKILDDKSNNDAKTLLLSTKKAVRKYKIKKVGNTNISLDAVGLVMTNHNPCLLLDENVFKSNPVQKALSSGFVELVEKIEERFDENGKIVHSIVDEFHDEEKPKTYIERPDSTEFSHVDVMWEGPIFDSGGYANMNREYIFNLTRMGVTVRPTLVKTSDDIERPIVDEITRLASNRVSPRCPKVYATNAPGKNAGRIVSYTMMETEKRIHSSLAKMIDTAGEVWVPSEWNRQVFLNSAIKKPIFTMPLGVNTDLYRPQPPKVVYSFPVKSFVFYSCSTWIWRKGFDVLVKAYAKAFSADDDVSLVIFTKWLGGRSCGHEAIIGDIKTHVPNKGSLPHLAVITKVLPDKVMPHMYNSTNAFVLFSRGEGWGLPYCEASASGVPVIGADHGGQQMFLNDGNSFLVRPDRVALCPRSMHFMSPHYHGMHFADYSENAIGKAADMMRNVYENYKEALLRAEKCRNNILENYTWRRAAVRVAERLRDIQ